MLDAIANNAFRIIGTPANAKVKDRLANLSKIKAYARIGKPLSFPLDLSKIIKKTNRTLEVVQQSISALNMPNELLKHSLFWFYSINPEQEEAIKFIDNNDFKSAEKIYRQGSDFSSIISYSTLLFIQKRDNQAVRLLNKFIKLPELKDDFLSFTSNIYGQPITLTSEGLLEIILDGLLETYRPYDLLKIYMAINKEEKLTFYNNIEQIINRKNAEKLLKKLETNTKAMENLVDSNIAKAFHGCDKYLEDARLDLRYLEKSMGSSSEFKNTSDNLAKSVLHCVVAYMNVQDEPNYNASKKSLGLLKKAKNLAFSETLISNIDTNIDSLSNLVGFFEF